MLPVARRNGLRNWAYQGDAGIDAYAAYTKVPLALAQRTRDEFYPKQSLQLAEVKGSTSRSSRRRSSNI